MAPAKRRAGGAKPAGKAPPHSLVTFAVNQGVDIEHARAQLNAFAEKYGAMMDTTAREALKHITADGLGPEYVEHCVATSSLREIRESQSQRSDGDRPAEGSPPAEPPRDTTERGAQIPPGAQIAPDPPPPSDPDSDSESLGVLARNERRRAEAAADRLPAAPRAAPRRAREPPAEPSSPSPSRNPNPIQIPTSPPRNSQTPRTRTTNPTPSSRRTTRRKRTTTTRTSTSSPRRTSRTRSAR